MKLQKYVRGPRKFTAFLEKRIHNICSLNENYEKIVFRATRQVQDR